MFPALFADIQSTVDQIQGLLPDGMRDGIVTVFNRQFVTEQLIPAIATFLIGRWALKLAVRFLNRTFTRFDADETLAKFGSTLAYYVGLLLVSLSALGKLGVPTENFTAIVAAGGLAIGLALKDSLSNFASGVMIIMFRPFGVNDVVEVAGTKGKVEAIHVLDWQMGT